MTKIHVQESTVFIYFLIDSGITDLVTSVVVFVEQIWEALLEKMPMTAMIRNLGKMTNVGVLAPLSDGMTKVCEMLRNEKALKDARVHPFSILLALKQYQAGQGDKGKLTWTPNQAIVTALDEAFYLAFKVCVQYLFPVLILQTNM